jgi:hypothetical protein
MLGPLLTISDRLTAISYQSSAISQLAASWLTADS